MTRCQLDNLSLRHSSLGCDFLFTCSIITHALGNYYNTTFSMTHKLATVSVIRDRSMNLPCGNHHRHFRCFISVTRPKVITEISEVEMFTGIFIELRLLQNLISGQRNIYFSNIFTKCVIEMPCAFLRFFLF